MTGLLVVLGGAAGGCGQVVCSCPGPVHSAVIDLGCVPTEPPVVKTTGPCSVCPQANPNGSIPNGSDCAAAENSQYITLEANGAGTCHVELTFGSGAKSSVDLDFVSQWAACGSDPHGCGQGFVATNYASVPESACDAGLEVDATTDAGA